MVIIVVVGKVVVDGAAKVEVNQLLLTNSNRGKCIVASPPTDYIKTKSKSSLLFESNNE